MQEREAKKTSRLRMCFK